MSTKMQVIKDRETYHMIKENLVTRYPRRQPHVCQCQSLHAATGRSTVDPVLPHSRVRNILNACGSRDHFGPEAQYDLPAQSATKKAKKDAQGLEERRLKAEAEEREACERQEKREKRLEESKRIVLLKDASLPTPVKSKIVLLPNYRNKPGSSHRVTGTLKLVPEGQKAPGGRELVADYWKVLGPAPGGDDAFTNKLNKESFRAEKSPTRRHLSEYTHLKSDLTFINFDSLMTYIEAISRESVARVLANPALAALVKMLNPDFTAPGRPFKHGKPVMVSHAVGDDIAEAAERQKTDIIGEPIFSYGFPAEFKAFYVQKMSQKERLVLHGEL
ncbi:hypothetical protein EDD16DRAFT_1709346 [Pisolithus croceorrhizus]|nr:hypothetical protein EDD16DRAFT_1709346 [Pisolithus croceorrhizus]